MPADPQRRYIMRTLTTLSVFLVLPYLAFATTFYVPDNYAKIQGAIDASSNGDTVIVRSGTYAENVDFVGKAITVKSEMGAVVTTIDGNQKRSVVTFKSGEGLDSVLEGFTLTNGKGTFGGYWYNGGGINCRSSSSPTITNNVISNNTAKHFGGGIGLEDSSPVIANNVISNNTAAGFGGGIGCNHNSSPEITNNTVSGNTSNYEGGGIYCRDSSPEITNNTVSGNTAEDDGGGIYCDPVQTGYIGNITDRAHG